MEEVAFDSLLAAGTSVGIAACLTPYRRFDPSGKVGEPSPQRYRSTARPGHFEFR
jgi:hypothetical protein